MTPQWLLESEAGLPVRVHRHRAGRLLDKTVRAATGTARVLLNDDVTPSAQPPLQRKSTRASSWRC